LGISENATFLVRADSRRRISSVSSTRHHRHREPALAGVAIQGAASGLLRCPRSGARWSPGTCGLSADSKVTAHVLKTALPSPGSTRGLTRPSTRAAVSRVNARIKSGH